LFAISQIPYIFFHLGIGSSNVVALDERNLKRAVNRYGTMPKGARIGAYLESLRQSGMTPEPVTEQGVESDAVVDSGNPHFIRKKIMIL
jgi:hypothetical protein